MDFFKLIFPLFTSKASPKDFVSFFFKHRIFVLTSHRITILKCPLLLMAWLTAFDLLFNSQEIVYQAQAALYPPSVDFLINCL